MNLEESIYDYLSNKNINYAIMINGEWGSGKTFFIKKNVIKKYNNALYVSLYGLSSIDKISEKIYLEIIKSKAVTNPISLFFKKLYNIFIFKILFIPFIYLFKLIKLIYSLFFKLIWIITYNLINLRFGINVSEVKKEDFYGVLKLFKNLNKFILVFDDLERCSVPIEEVMGFINDFVEHNNMKCIIVANEDEILRTQSDNYELKVLTAISDRIDFPNESDNKNKKQDALIDIDNINKRIDYLYNDRNKYKIIKEKLIGREFKFIPKLEDAYDNLAFKYSKKYELYKILNNTKKVVLNTMVENNSYNIRTLDFYFDCFNYIYKCSDEFIISSKIDYDYMYSNISSSLISQCILIKSGTRIKMLSRDKKFDYVSYGDKVGSLLLSKLILSFDYINEYLIYNRIEKSDIEETINSYAETHSDKIGKDDPYNLLNEYWIYSSKELDKILEEICNNIKSNKYSSSLYLIIIKKISYIEAMGYNNKKVINSIINEIKNNISGEQTVIITEEFNFFNDQKANDIYNAHVDSILDVIDKNKMTEKENKLQSIYSSEEWGVEFNKYVEEHKSDFLMDKRFMSQLDISKLLDLLEKSSIKNVYYFKYSIDKIYNFSNVKDYFKDDLDSLNEFKNMLNERINIEQIEDPMLKYPFNLLLDELDKVITRLDK